MDTTGLIRKYKIYKEFGCELSCEEFELCNLLESKYLNLKKFDYDGREYYFDNNNNYVFSIYEILGNTFCLEVNNLIIISHMYKFKEIIRMFIEYYYNICINEDDVFFSMSEKHFREIENLFRTLNLIVQGS